MTSRDLMHGLCAMDLFARRTDPSTSHAAADSMQSHASVQRQQILDCAAKEARPLTADDFDRILGFRPSTSGRRLGELCSFRADYVMVYLDGGVDPDSRPPQTRMGDVRVPRVDGITRSGRKANCYILRSLLSTLKE